MSEASVVSGIARQMRLRLPGLSRCRVGVVLGSGLGEFAESLDQPETLDYGLISDLPRAAVPGHKGRLVVGGVDGAQVAVAQGRVHMYEGYTADEVCRCVRALAQCGVQVIVLTNAAGAIRGGLKIGDLVLMKDHINLSGRNPMTGQTDGALGQLFLDTTDLYSEDLRAKAKARCAEGGTSLHEGVYAALLGPTYETPAEIRMLGLLGADLVGMSTAMEALAAHAAGARVLGMSFVTNIAAGLSTGALSHREVTDAANAAQDSLTRALRGVVLAMHDATEPGA